MTQLYNRIRASREAGMVQRCHTMQIHGHYTIAEHCYNVVSILLILHPEPSMTLIKAALWHDQAERWLGDVPAPAKWAHPELAKVYAAAEQKMLAESGFFFRLNDDEANWLKAVDTLELWMTAKEQLLMGNSQISKVVHNCDRWFADNEARVPMPVRTLILQYDFTKGGDTPWM